MCKLCMIPGTLIKTPYPYGSCFWPVCSQQAPWNFFLNPRRVNFSIFSQGFIILSHQITGQFATSPQHLVSSLYTVWSLHGRISAVIFKCIELYRHLFMEFSSLGTVVTVLCFQGSVILMVWRLCPSNPIFHVDFFFSLLTHIYVLQAFRVVNPDCFPLAFFYSFVAKRFFSI